MWKRNAVLKKTFAVMLMVAAMMICLCGCGVDDIDISDFREYMLGDDVFNGVVDFKKLFEKTTLPI